jgi:hypothetical protein
VKDVKDILKRLISRDFGTTHWEGCEEDHILCASAQEIRSLRSRIAELEADVVFAVEKLAWSENPPHRFIDCDATPADILRAVKEARNGVS